VIETMERSELVTAGPAEGLVGLVGVPMPDLAAGEGLPLLWHWVYMLERPAQAELGPDGHPVTGGILTAPGRGRRRMFAGGRVHATAPLRVGELATRRSFIRSSTDKQGRSGLLTFVTVIHEISQGGQVIIVDEQDIVYRDAADLHPAGSQTAAPPDTSTGSTSTTVAPPIDQHAWQVPIDPVLLFRFSALTYNGHRIHYDRDYARDVEGYPGLVVHGPLQALLMAESCRQATGFMAPEPTAFEYRLLAPLFDHQGLIASWIGDGDRTVTARIRDSAGRTTAEGKLQRGI
jgi:3-methylfumaryl-CoA hydratase